MPLFDSSDNLQLFMIEQQRFDLMRILSNLKSISDKITFDLVSFLKSTP